MSTHDAAGNLTYDGVHQYTYDAWNRLVKVEKAWRDNSDDGAGGVTLGSIETGSVVMAARYDGLGRRIVKEIKNSADLDMTYHYYHRGGSGGQVIETRDGSDLPIRQYVWSLGYIDELVQIAMNDDPTDDTEGDGTQALCESTYYALHNANYNVQLVVDDAGVIAERYEYSPYGRRQVYFSPGTNDPDAHAPTSMSRRWSLTGGGTGAPGSVHPYGLNPRGHQGLNHDEHVRLVHNRARTLHPRIGRFMQRDPLGYVDGTHLHSYVENNPVYRLDPNGTTWINGEIASIVSFIHRFTPANHYANVVDAMLRSPHVDASGKFPFVLSALQELNRSANPTPPNSFVPATWEVFVKSKEYRGLLRFRPTLCCDNGRVTSYKIKDKEVSHGFTPVRLAGPDSATVYQPGIGSNQKIVFGLGTPCIRVQWRHHFRIGRRGAAITRLTTGVAPPWVRHSITYEMCCSKRYDIRYKGSFFPTHYSYFSDLKFDARNQSNMGAAMFLYPNKLLPTKQFAKKAGSL